ncbi:hypothetical protein E8E11_000187 [Didymella keratinophila]|nr:hypothetical protein E8E11_000187 [Didymella keratinophila]
MRFQNILLAYLLGVGLGGAFTIPEGTEDGVYEHYIESNGNDVHIKLANATHYDSNELPHRDTDAANADFDWQCDHYDPTPPRHNFYSIRGSTLEDHANSSTKSAASMALLCAFEQNLSLVDSPKRRMSPVTVRHYPESDL